MSRSRELRALLTLARAQLVSRSARVRFRDAAATTAAFSQMCRSWLHAASQVARMPRFNPLQLLGDNRTVAGFHLGRRWDRPDVLGEEMGAVAVLWREGKIRPRVDSRIHSSVRPTRTVGCTTGRTWGRWCSCRSRRRRSEGRAWV